MDPRRRTLPAGRARPANGGQVPGVGDRDAGQERGGAVDDPEHGMSLLRAEKRALPAGLVVEDEAAQIEPHDEPEPRRGGREVEEPGGPRREGRSRRVRPLPDEAAERAGQGHVEGGGSRDHAADAGEAAPGQQARQGGESGSTASERPDPPDAHAEIDEHAPQHEAEQREGEHVDPPAAVQRGQREAGREGQPEQRQAEPPRPAEEGERRVHHGEPRHQPGAEDLRARGEEVLRGAGQRPIRRVEAGGADRLAETPGGLPAGRRAVRDGEQRALGVGLLDGLHEQDGGERALPHRAAQARAGVTAGRAGRRSGPGGRAGCLAAAARGGRHRLAFRPRATA